MVSLTDHTADGRLPVETGVPAELIVAVNAELVGAVYDQKDLTSLLDWFKSTTESISLSCDRGKRTNICGPYVRSSLAVDKSLPPELWKGSNTSAQLSDLKLANLEVRTR